MESSRDYNIARLAGGGKIEGLKDLLDTDFTQSEIDNALSNALAYSEIETAEYLISLGADISWGNYEGAYYAAHNNELKGLQFILSQGVDVNINNGMLLNTCVMTAINTKSNEMLEWLVEKGANLNLLSADMKKMVQRYGSLELKKLLNSGSVIVNLETINQPHSPQPDTAHEQLNITPHDNGK